MPKVVNNPDNKVIIIGGDHHNGLNLARIFGLNGKKVFAVVITDQAKSWMVKSKFIDGYSIFKTEKEGLDFVLEKFSSEPAKPFIIPYSDGAALELDLRLNEFKEKFFVPSINGKQGEIAGWRGGEGGYKECCQSIRLYGRELYEARTKGTQRNAIKRRHPSA